MIKHIRFLLAILSIVFFTTSCREHHDIVSLFSLKNYDQTISHWLDPANANYDTPVIKNEAQRHLATFYKHYIGESSPWNADYINRVLRETDSDGLKKLELDIIHTYSNENKTPKETSYGENFVPYSSSWMQAIADNIDFSQLVNLHYNASNRAIAIDNLDARALPTSDPSFYSYKIAGQGYPFDNLQISALWVGTPVYILADTHDHAWSLVATPDYIGWVKSSGLARTSDAFIKTWEKAALKHLAAITQTQTSIMDVNHVYRFSAYVGSVFPALDNLKLMIPIADAKQHAVISYALLAKNQAAMIPLAPTPRNFSNIMRTLAGRPYGWGNLYFYNDCSSELKSLFTPFGVWLPRHSLDQVYAGKFIDLSEKSPEERIQYLIEHGQALVTLVYIDGHVMLFVGNFPNPNSKKHETIAMTYQNKWGLMTLSNSRRAVIGKSAFLPLLEKYPEDSGLMSLAAEKHFKISQLEGVPDDNLEKLEIIDLKALMYP